MTTEEESALARIIATFDFEPFDAAEAFSQCQATEDTLERLLEAMVIERIGKERFRVADAGHG